MAVTTSTLTEGVVKQIVGASDTPTWMYPPEDRITSVMICPCSKIEHGAVTGTGFQVGETVTGSVSGRTGVVATVGSGFLYVFAEVGANVWDVTAPTDTITGSTSGSTASLTNGSSVGTSSGYPFVTICPRSEIAAGKAQRVAWPDGAKTSAFIAIANGSITGILPYVSAGACVFYILPIAA